MAPSCFIFYPRGGLHNACPKSNGHLFSCSEFLPSGPHKVCSKLEQFPPALGFTIMGQQTACQVRMVPSCSQFCPRVGPQKVCYPPSSTCSSKSTNKNWVSQGKTWQEQQENTTHSHTTKQHENICNTRKHTLFISPRTTKTTWKIRRPPDLNNWKNKKHTSRTRERHETPQHKLPREKNKQARHEHHKENTR